MRIPAAFMISLVAVCALLAASAAAAPSDIDITGTVDAAGFTQSGSSTLSNSISGSATDLSCTDCIGTTEIGDVYLLNNGDTGTGQYVFSSTSSPGVRIGDLSIGFLQVGGSTISDNAGSLTLDSDSASTVIVDDLMVTGNDILDSGASPRITLGSTTTLTGIVAVTSNLSVDSVSSALFVDTESDRVGIGTSAPSQRLHVTSTEDANTQVLVQNPSASGTSALAGLNLQASTAAMSSIAHGGARTLTRYGITLANYTEILSYAGEGLVIGTGALEKPIILGTNGTERVRIDASGRVGIGTASPSTFLDITRNASGASDLRNFIRINNTDTGTASTANLQLLAGASGNSTSLTHVSSSYTVVADRQDYGQLSNTGPGLILLAPHATGVLRFITGSGTSERMRIDSAGNVGINISAPTETLHVVGNATITGGNTLKFDANNVGAPSTSMLTGSRLILYPTSAGSHYAIGIEGSHMWFNSDGGYKFYRDAGATPAMLIDTSGNVGVGTASANGLEVRAAVTETAGSADAVRLGVLSGSPRIIFEDSGKPLWQIDSVGPLRFFQPGAVYVTVSSETTTGIMNISNPKSTDGKIILNLDFSGDVNTASASDQFIVFRNQGGEVGSINTNVQYTTFTGAHAGQSRDDTSAWEEGMIVSSTGEVLTRDVSRALVGIRLSDSVNDSAVAGVYSSSRFPHSMAGLDPSRPVLTYNALGEGMALVTDTNGDIALGDLITTSGRAGYGQRQGDDLIRSYTVAKANEAVRWDDVTADPRTGFKRKLIAVTYPGG